MATYNNTNFVSTASTGRQNIAPGTQLLEFTVEFEGINDGAGVAAGEWVNLATLPTGAYITDIFIRAVEAVTNGSDIDVGMTDGNGADGSAGQLAGIEDSFDGSAADNRLQFGTGTVATTAVAVQATDQVLAVLASPIAAVNDGVLHIGVVVALPLS